jgi:hypothetical protein
LRLTCATSLRGNVHPLTAASAAKTLNSEIPMEQMILSLKPDPAQEAELAQLIAAQNSPLFEIDSYHRSPARASRFHFRC